MADNNDLAKSLTSTDLSGSMRKATFDNLEDSNKPGADFNEIDLVMDVPVQVTVELGRAKMQIRNLLIAISAGGRESFLSEYAMLRGDAPPSWRNPVVFCVLLVRVSYPYTTATPTYQRLERRRFLPF